MTSCPFCTLASDKAAESLERYLRTKRALDPYMKENERLKGILRQISTMDDTKGMRQLALESLNVK